MDILWHYLFLKKKEFQTYLYFRSRCKIINYIHFKTEAFLTFNVCKKRSPKEHFYEKMVSSNHKVFLNLFLTMVLKPWSNLSIKLVHIE